MVGQAKVKGTLYDMGDYPAAIPSSTEQFIIGELYRIRNEKEFTWAICQLDDYEGVLVESHEEPLYRRELCEVDINGQSVSAWIYWYNGDVSGKPVIVSGDTLEYLKNK